MDTITIIIVVCAITLPFLYIDKRDNKRRSASGDYDSSDFDSNDSSDSGDSGGSGGDGGGD